MGLKFQRFNHPWDLDHNPCCRGVKSFPWFLSGYFSSFEYQQLLVDCGRGKAFNGISKSNISLFKQWLTGGLDVWMFLIDLWTFYQICAWHVPIKNRYITSERYRHFFPKKNNIGKIRLRVAKSEVLLNSPNFGWKKSLQHHHKRLPMKKNDSCLSKGHSFWPSYLQLFGL